MHGFSNHWFSGAADGFDEFRKVNCFPGRQHAQRPRSLGGRLRGRMTAMPFQALRKKFVKTQETETSPCDTSWIFIWWFGERLYTHLTFVQMANLEVTTWPDTVDGSEIRRFPVEDRSFWSLH